jgi:hypothetical protein
VLTHLASSTIGDVLQTGATSTTYCVYNSMVSLSLDCGRVSTASHFSSDFPLLYATQSNTPLLCVLRVKALVELGTT